MARKKDTIQTFDELLSAIGEMFVNQNEHNDDQFGRLDTRMDNLEGRMGGLEGRMDGLEGRMDGLEGRMDGIEDQINGLGADFENFRYKTTLQFKEVNTKLDNLDGRLEAIENDVKEIYKMLAHLDKDFVPRRVFDKVVARLEKVEKELSTLRPLSRSH